MKKLINIGYGNVVNSSKVVAVISAESAPAKRMITQAKDDLVAVDATQGKKTKSVIVMDSGHIVLSPLMPETISLRFGEENQNE
ncbi:hypothetical protein SAMN02910289_00116 [Lachnospiraceae bacterium RM5]|nr:hypothetical protein SAMN02910289_00116 [Lachnospiraceae bacterium RM5]